MIGPWVYAFSANAANPAVGKDGGVFEMATYLSVLTVPIGFLFLFLALLTRPKGNF